MFEFLSPFPTLHPLIVHAPIVLLTLTPALLLTAWGLRSRALEWVSLCLLAIGWLGALLASKVFHPHVDAMTLLAQDALRIHELWADWTLGLGAAALLLLVPTLVPRFSKLRGILRGFVVALTLATMATVILAGHYGALLTHVYEVNVEKGD